MYAKPFSCEQFLFFQKGFIRSDGLNSDLFETSDKPQVVEYWSDENQRDFRDLGTYVFETTVGSEGI